MGDNGKEIVKTESELATERLARYQDNPRAFTENTELVLGVKKTPTGLAYILGNNTAQGLKILKWDIDAQLDAAIFNVIAESKSKIVTPPKGSMFNFARNKR